MKTKKGGFAPLFEKDEFENALEAVKNQADLIFTKLIIGVLNGWNDSKRT